MMGEKTERRFGFAVTRPDIVDRSITKKRGCPGQLI